MQLRSKNLNPEYSEVANFGERQLYLMLCEVPLMLYEVPLMLCEVSAINYNSIKDVGQVQLRSKNLNPEYSEVANFGERQLYLILCEVPAINYNSIKDVGQVQLRSKNLNPEYSEVANFGERQLYLMLCEVSLMLCEVCNFATKSKPSKLRSCKS